MSTFSALPKENSLCPLMESERVRNRERKRARERERKRWRVSERKMKGRQSRSYGFGGQSLNESVGGVGDKKMNMKTQTETNTITAIQNSCTEQRRTTHANTHAKAYACTSPSWLSRFVRSVLFRLFRPFLSFQDDQTISRLLSAVGTVCVMVYWR